MKLNSAQSTLRLEPVGSPPRPAAPEPGSSVPPEHAGALAEPAAGGGLFDTPSVPSPEPSARLAGDRNAALRPNVPSQLSLTGAGAEAGATVPALDPLLSGAPDDATAFQAAQRLLDATLGGAGSTPAPAPASPETPAAAAGGAASAPAPAAYGELFGKQPFVADGADAQMLKLFGQAVAKAPELAGGPLAEHVRAGRLGEDDVRAMQGFLQQKSYSLGPTGVDGHYGPRTHAALSAFLKGEAPETTHDHGEGPTLRRGASGEAVRKLQERLAALGFAPQGVDGQFGPKTLAAVEAFQRAQGLEPDGIVGPQTWDKLGIRVAHSDADSVPEVGADGVHQTSDGPMVQRSGKYMRAELAPAWDQMVAAAARDGVKLRITSGYRSKERQEELWQEALQKYGSADAARKWVAPPGNSNHQHGKALDIEMGDGVYDWLTENGPKFGFTQRMSWEPWHWEHDV